MEREQERKRERSVYINIVFLWSILFLWREINIRLMMRIPNSYSYWEDSVNYNICKALAHNVIAKTSPDTNRNH